MNILFLCTANLHRSRTAEHYFRQIRQTNTYRSAGLSEKYCSQHQTTLCTVAMLEWADRVFVMEQAHLDRLREYSGEQFLPKVSLLNIPDEFQYMQLELIQLLKLKASPSLTSA